MKNDIYRIKSQDTLEYTSFHDCVIKQAEWENDNLVLYFDELFILRNHPENDTGKAKQTDDTLVCFENVKVLKSELHDSEKAVANAIEIKDIAFFDALKELYIFSLDIEKSGETYICKIEGEVEGEAGYKEIEFEYSGVYICFNNFTCNAWFDNV